MTPEEFMAQIEETNTADENRRIEEALAKNDEQNQKRESARAKAITNTKKLLELIGIRANEEDFVIEVDDGNIHGKVIVTYPFGNWNINFQGYNDKDTGYHIPGCSVTSKTVELLTTSDIQAGRKDAYSRYFSQVTFTRNLPDVRHQADEIWEEAKEEGIVRFGYNGEKSHPFYDLECKVEYQLDVYTSYESEPEAICITENVSFATKIAYIESQIAHALEQFPDWKADMEAQIAAERQRKEKIKEEAAQKVQAKKRTQTHEYTLEVASPEEALAKVIRDVIQNTY